jgi:hypothetical protein
MTTLELINTLIDDIVGNKMVAEIIKNEIAAHTKFDPIVILQRDPEGNGFSPASGAEEALYLPDTTWRGTVITKEDMPDHDPLSIQKCIVLWPKG